MLEPTASSVPIQLRLSPRLSLIVMQSTSTVDGLPAMKRLFSLADCILATHADVGQVSPVQLHLLQYASWRAYPAIFALEAFLCS